MDVTAEIVRNTLVYGASDYTAPHSLSSSKSLNYVTGGSITKPDVATVSIIPFTLNYQDSVGLFGAENYFIKINVKVDPTASNKCFEEEFWECARLSIEEGTTNTYRSAIVDIEKDVPIQYEETVDQGYYYPELTSGPPDYISDTYDPYTVGSGDDLDGNSNNLPYDQFDYEFAKITGNKLFLKSDSYVSVDLNNLKTGNKYIDAWFDVRLYNKGREEHPYDKMYVRMNDFFYIGFHARNTRRLPYNVECIVGNEYLSEVNFTDEQRRYIAKRVS